MKNLLLLPLLAFIGTYTFTSCKSGSDSSDKKSDTTATNELKGASLNILCWEGYADPLFAKGFEEKYGVTVKGTYFGSSDELVSKLQNGGDASFDVISPS